MRHYIGGCVILPLLQNDDTLPAFFVTFSTVISQILSQLKCYLYILCPYHNNQSLQFRIKLIYSLHSLLQNFINLEDILIFDVSVFFVNVDFISTRQVPLRQSGCGHLLSQLQSNALLDLLTISSPIQPAFVEQSSPDDPVALFEIPHPEKEEDSKHFSKSTTLLMACLKTLKDAGIAHHVIPWEEEVISSNALKREVDQFITGYDVRDDDLKMVDSCVIGGTFDHLHLGHKYLFLMMTQLTQRNIIIGLVDDVDAMLMNKSGRSALQPVNSRVVLLLRYFTQTLRFQNIHIDIELCQEINRFNTSALFEISYRQMREQIRDRADHSSVHSVSLEIVFISDPIGPAGTRSDVTALIVTTETRHGGEAVNKCRQERGLASLKLLEFPLLQNLGAPKDDQSYHQPSLKMSSTQIREKISSDVSIQKIAKCFLDSIECLKLPIPMQRCWCIQIIEILTRASMRRRRENLVKVLESILQYSEPLNEANTFVMSDRQATFYFTKHEYQKCWLSLSVLFGIICSTTNEPTVTLSKIKKLMECFIQDRLLDHKIVSLDFMNEFKYNFIHLCVAMSTPDQPIIPVEVYKLLNFFSINNILYSNTKRAIESFD